MLNITNKKIMSTIDVQPYLDKLNQLTEYINAKIDVKVWMQMPLKPFPYDSLYKIEKYNKRYVA